MDYGWLVAAETHTIRVVLASKIGINESLLLDKIGHWVAKNASNNKHMHDGKYWTRMTAEAWSKMFPYLTEGKIRGALARLEKKNLIITDNFNITKYDRTLWYTLTKEGVGLLGETQPKSKQQSQSDCKQSQKKAPLPGAVVDVRIDQTDQAEYLRRAGNHIVINNPAGFATHKRRAWAQDAKAWLRDKQQLDGWRKQEAQGKPNVIAKLNQICSADDPRPAVQVIREIYYKSEYLAAKNTNDVFDLINVLEAEGVSEIENIKEVAEEVIRRGIEYRTRMPGVKGWPTIWPYWVVDAAKGYRL